MKNNIIRYVAFDTPIGPLGAATSENGVLMINLNCTSKEKFRKKLANTFGTVTLSTQQDTLLIRTRSQLAQYISGKRREFDLPLDLQTTDFQRRVLEKVFRIPYGKTATYGEIARKVGSPRAARAVGGAVGSNPIPLIIPCHRVLAAGGKIGGFGGGLPLKKKLLKLEND